MERELSAILAELPDNRPRSRLEPYRELIIELRGREFTFQDIAEVLAQKCGVRVTGSGIHDFLRRRNCQAKAKLCSSQQKSVTEKTKRYVWMESAKEKIGRYSEISTKATNIPMKIIMTGSIRLSAAVTCVETSSS